MSKTRILQPDLVLGDVVIQITPSLIKKYDLRGLILDVDETLLPWNEKQISPPLQEWVGKIRQFAQLWLVSNNISENRIATIAKSLDLPFIFGAGKPSRRKLREAVNAMNLPLSNIAMVGDRIFTDVLAGNRLGLFTILVEPMNSEGGKKLFSLRNFEVWLSLQLGINLNRS